MTTTIHPTAAVDPAARLGDGVEIGPHCHVGPDVTIGGGTRLLANSVILGPAEVGEENRIGPMASFHTHSHRIRAPSPE